MNRLIVTKWKQFIATALADDKKIFQLTLEPEEEGSILNNIYIGKVQNIQKNIHAAFIDLGNGITGYYSLDDNSKHLYVNPKQSGRLCAGDELIVQVCREAVKTKAPVLTSHLAFPGKLAVLTVNSPGIGFSSKIKDSHWKEEMRLNLQKEINEDFGIIIRTNAKDASVTELIKEIRQLRQSYERLLENARYRNCYCLLSQAPKSFLSGIRNAYASELHEMITDDDCLYQQIYSFLQEEQPKDLPKLRFYQDNLLPLRKLYCLEQTIEKGTAKKVWLKSGGYLVIEPTEAMVVIDVNTGKYSGKKTMEETILMINLEAVNEIGYQLRLRNLSGIILVDFIDMASEEHQKLLLEHLEKVVQKDPVKTTVVDITRLNLVEITRKKIQRPLYEQLSRQWETMEEERK